MTTAFTRTLRALRADGFRRTLGMLLVAAVLFATWGGWMVYAQIARYEITDSARLEVAQAPHVLQASSSGKVVTSNLVLGRQVQAGDVLVELDANPEFLLIQEQRARVSVLDPQLESLRAERAAAIQARTREQETARSALEEARTRIREAEQPSKFAESEVARLKQLMDLGLASEREYARAQSESSRASASVESLRQALPRLEQEHRTRDTDREAQIRRLESEIHRLEGEQTTTSAAITRLQYDADARRVLAPVSGRLGEVATLHTGAVLREGDSLGTIIPSGTLKILAQFAPSAALGRIRSGQPARLRLKGFPWTQYGTIAARVSTVANEVRDGTVRVEFDLVSELPVSIPVEHGLTGTVEVQVEQVSPLTLALRAAGGLVAAPRVLESQSTK